MKGFFLRGMMIHPRYGFIIPNGLSHLKSGNEKKCLFNNTVCYKDANLEARDLRLLLILHKTQVSLDGDDLAKAENSKVLNIKIAQISAKYICQYFKI